MNKDGGKSEYLFKKGTSGNPNGRPRRLTGKYPRFNVAEILQDKGCNPFIILADIALNSLSEKSRLEAALQLAKYVAPQLKSVAHIAENTNPFAITLNLGGASNLIAALEKSDG